MSLSKSMRKLRLALEAHRKALLSEFVPIQKGSAHTKLVPVKKRVHFALPVVFILCTFTYGNLGLPYEAANGISNWQLQSLATNPYVFTHQMVPPSFWYHFDIANGLTVLSSVLSFLYVAFRANIDGAFVLVQSHDCQFSLGGQPLERRLCEQFGQFHKWIHLLTWSCIVSLYINLMTFYLVNLYLNNVYTFTLGSAIFWFALLPAYVFYMTYSNLGFQMYIIVSSQIIRIRQANLLAQLAQLNAIRPKTSPTGRQMASRKWHQYLELNRQLVNLCQQIGEYKRLNAPLLSILVPYLMLIMAYVTTVALYGHPATLSFCLVGICETNAWLYLIIHECSQIDQLNGSIERAMRHFYLGFFGTKAELMPIGAQLKAETFQASDRLNLYVFSFLGDGRITSKTFHAIFLYTSSFFMFIFKGHSVTN